MIAVFFICGILRAAVVRNPGGASQIIQADWRKILLKIKTGPVVVEQLTHRTGKGMGDLHCIRCCKRGKVP